MQKTYENREYQDLHIKRVEDSISVNQSIVAQLPTGGGKTVEFSKIINRYINTNKNSSILVVVHREELLNQACRTIKSITGIEPSLITKEVKYPKFSRVYIGMIESTMKRIDKIFNVDLIIVDECHLANFNKLHNAFASAKIIGFTATPISSSKKEPLKKYYSDIIVGPQISELIKCGHLVQNITRCPDNVIKAVKIDIDRLSGDYNEKQLAEEYTKSRNIKNLEDIYRKFCFRKGKTIIFNVNIEHNNAVTEYLQYMGYNVRSVDGSSKDRKEIIEWFKNTEDAVLCNVMIATVGFDEPSVKNVILNFSTLSLVKFIQCCGRGGRPFDKKMFFNIIDLGGNCIRFGDWSDDRDWYSIFNNPDKAGDGIAPKKECPSCGGLVHASSHTCKLPLESGDICGYVFDKKKAKQEAELGELVVVTKNIDVRQLQFEFNHKYDFYTFFELGERVVKEIFEKYSSPSASTIEKGFKAYYELCIDWWNEFMSPKKDMIKDISNSAWHIKRAKTHYDKLISEQMVKIADKNSL